MSILKKNKERKIKLTEELKGLENQYRQNETFSQNIKKKQCSLSLLEKLIKRKDRVKEQEKLYKVNLSYETESASSIESTRTPDHLIRDLKNVEKSEMTLN